LQIGLLDNFHSLWKSGIAHGKILIPAGEGKSSFDDAYGIDASAAAVLVSDQRNGHAFDLTRPEALSYADAGASAFAQSDYAQEIFKGRPAIRRQRNHSEVMDRLFHESNRIAGGTPDLWKCGVSMAPTGHTETR